MRMARRRWVNMTMHEKNVQYLYGKWVEGIDEDEAQRERVAMQESIDERYGVPEATDEEWDEAIAEDKWRVSGGLCGRTLQTNTGSFDIVDGMGG